MKGLRSVVAKTLTIQKNAYCSWFGCLKKISKITYYCYFGF